MVRNFISSEYPTMTGQNIQINSVQIAGGQICEIPPPFARPDY